MSQLVNFLKRESLGKGIADIPDPLGARLAELLLDGLAIGGLLIEPVNADLQSAQRLLKAFLESATDRHDLAHRFHLRGEMRIGGREFLESKARHLGDDIVDRRLEGRGRGTAGDVVAQLVEGVAHRQLGRHLGNRKPGCLRGERRRARDPGIHLDHDHATGIGVDGELNIRAPGINADLAQDGDRGIAHQLVFLVGQGLCRRHRDRVAGVDTHRIEVFDRADDDAVVAMVANHFHLELFPADQALFDQQLAGGRGFEAALADGLEFFCVVGDATAGATERETRPDDRGKAEQPLDRPGLVERMRDARASRAQPDAGHGFLELLTVFGLVDGLGRGADQFAAVALEHAMAMQIERAIERGLASHRGKDGVGTLLVDDALDHLPGDRLDVGDIGRARVGHDRGRIAVDQDHPKAFLAQRLAGLSAGIVELAGLADDDRAGPDDENAGNVGTARHVMRSPSGR